MRPPPSDLRPADSQSRPPADPPSAPPAFAESPRFGSRRAFLVGAVALSAAPLACVDEKSDSAPFGSAGRPPSSNRATAARRTRAADVMSVDGMSLDGMARDSSAPSAPFAAVRGFALPMDVEPPVMFRPLVADKPGRKGGT